MMEEEEGARLRRREDLRIGAGVVVDDANS